MFTVVLIVVFVFCFAFLFREGTWSNAIQLINVITAALLATNFFEPVATWLESWGPSYTYAWDFLALWGLFALFMSILRGATDFISKTKVRFRKVVDQVGSPLFAFWIAWVMVCFTAMSMHTAPLGRNFMLGSFQPEKRKFVTAPDRQWLGFVQKMSLGTFGTKAKGETLRQNSQWKERWEEGESLTFDPRGEFMPKYATRRARLESQIETSGTMRVRDAGGSNQGT